MTKIISVVVDFLPVQEVVPLFSSHTCKNDHKYVLALVLLNSDMFCLSVKSICTSNCLEDCPGKCAVR